MREHLERQADAIEWTLWHHGVQARVSGGTVGPRLVRFALHPAPGVRVSRLVNLTEELALALAAPACRVTRQAGQVVVELPRPDVPPLRLQDLTSRPGAVPRCGLGVSQPAAGPTFYVCVHRAQYPSSPAGTPLYRQYVDAIIDVELRTRGTGAEGGIMDEELRRQIDKATTVLKMAGAREVHLFGSAARGQLRSDSDVDLAVSGLPPAVFFRAMAQVSAVLQRPVDLVDLDEVTPFTRYLKEEGELQRVG